MPLVTGADFGLRFPRGNRTDISPIVNALGGMIQEEKQSRLAQQKQQTETLQQAYKATALDLLSIAKKPGLTAKRGAIVDMAKRAKLRGEDTGILSDLLTYTTDDELNTAILGIAHRAGEQDKMLTEAMGNAEGFTLSEGQTRFTGGGEKVAEIKASDKTKPLTPLAKARQDLKNNLITQQDFNSLRAAPKSFQTDVGKTIADKQLAIEMFGADSEQARAFQDAIDSDAKGDEPKLSDVSGMRKEFTKLSSDFIKLRDAIAKVESARDNPSPAGDLSLIFNFMKIQDPASVVRESEFETAQNATSLPGRLGAGVQRVLNGERMLPEQRADFVDTAVRLFEGQKGKQKQLEYSFTSLAERAGMNPEDVAIDFVGDDLNPEEQAELEALEAEYGNR
ncbi:MAG: hypothetical protein GY954_10710 [Alteromonas sp.]|nr:hypothetical protein [Alteromonas sp.]